MRNVAYNQDPREYDCEIDGELNSELCEAEAYERDIVGLVTVCFEKLKRHDDPFTMLAEVQNWIYRVQEAAENVKVWIEESDRDDPRANGWVGQDGRP